MSSKNGNVGELVGDKAPRWMTSNAGLLVDDIPVPACRWSWSDVDLTHGTLLRLKNMGMIQRTDDGEWRTTEELVQAIADYGRFDADRVGTVAGDVQLAAWSEDGEHEDDTRHVTPDDGEHEDDGDEPGVQGDLTAWTGD